MLQTYFWSGKNVEWPSMLSLYICKKSNAHGQGRRISAPVQLGWNPKKNCHVLRDLVFVNYCNHGAWGTHWGIIKLIMKHYLLHFFPVLVQCNFISNLAYNNILIVYDWQ